ncbi:MAG: hypothetical protein CSA24_01310 [Deltaproteobacteria bacterium]|nr:MAG: hypothetical protein CSA24_01310 [Deltaproteobacteria bacterium]
MSSTGGDEPLAVVVDSELRLPAETPRKLVLALRRQLRRHDLAKLLDHDEHHKGLFTLLSTQGDAHVMPQTLLPQLTETCRRQGIPFSVDDRRSSVSSPPLHHRRRLAGPQQQALHRLLLRDSGVLVAPAQDDRLALAAELVARRQQRTLVVAADSAQVRLWLATLGEVLALSTARGELARLGDASAAARVVVTSYEALTPGALAQHREAFGQLVLDAVHAVDPIRLLTALRGLAPRHLLGLAAESSRQDQLHGPLYLVLGGVAYELAAPVNHQALKLALRHRQTTFAFDYGGRSQYQALLAALASDQQRAAQIAEDVVNEVRAGQACLVLSERRDHLALLAEELPGEISAELVTSDIRPGDRTARVARFTRGEISVLFATGQIALEAVKTPRASRLFITFPFSHAQKLEKISAPLLAPAPGKQDAAIYDYDDVAVAPLTRGHAKRAKVLARLQRKADDTHWRWAQLSLNV